MLPVPEIPESIKARYPHLKNVSWSSPEGVPEEEVGTLPSLCGSYEGGIFDGGPHIRTYWKPSEEELEALNNGALIELIWFDTVIVPMSMNVEVVE